jgi:antitoxin component YwqK of YwqJK toxin-antitoxin module
MKKEIITYNNNGQLHGYIIVYGDSGNINYRGKYKNNRWDKYLELHETKQTQYHII